MIKYFFAHKYTSVWREGERGRKEERRGRERRETERERE